MIICHHTFMHGTENTKLIININDGVVKGEMPGRALRMILDWLDLHREELMDNWELAQKGAPLKKIEPLK